VAATSQGSARSHSSRSAHVVPFPVRPCGHGPHLQHSALDLELMMIFYISMKHCQECNRNVDASEKVKLNVKNRHTAEYFYIFNLLCSAK
jgi:hypothetical protein